MRSLTSSHDRHWSKLHLVLRYLLCCLELALLSFPAVALDPTRQISQYGHTAWRTQDGDFSGTPHAITQTKDGYLWIGTETGLIRFDGVRFVPWTPPSGKRLPSREVYSLLGASDGSLWIGTGRGLVRWKDGNLMDYSSTRGFVESIMEGPEGSIWIVRSQVGDEKTGGLCQVMDSGTRCLGPADGIPFTYAQAIARDASGNVWTGSSMGICKWNPESKKAEVYLPKGLLASKGLQGVSAIAAEPNGGLWVGMSWVGKGLGLQRFQANAWHDYVVPGFDSTKVRVSALLMDRDGGLWVGTQGEPVLRIYKDKVDRFASADGLSSDSVNSMYQDREGNVWIATTKGIDRFRDVAVATFSKREGLSSEEAQAVLATHDGTVWIANLEALDSWRDGKLSTVAQGKALPGRLVTSLYEDHSNRLWVGMDRGLTIYEHGQFRSINKADGSPLGIVTAIGEDTNNDIWVAVTTPAVFRIHGSDVAEEIMLPKMSRLRSLAGDPKDGIWVGMATGGLGRYRQGRLETVVPGHSPTSGIDNIFVDPDGSVWGATGEGLLRWKANRFETLGVRNGLPCSSISAVIPDDKGSLWLDGSCGYISVSRTELENWWQNPNYQVKTILLDALDGAQTGHTHFRPTASRSADGKLWFANQTVLQEIDPEHLRRNQAPPPVHIEQVVADHKSYDSTTNVKLPPLTRDLEIDYSAPSLAVPQKVRFRYQLEVHDADWQEAQGRRQAFYSDLAPGTYRFHLTAGNNDGLWNEVGTTMTITVLPVYYQTAWFRVLCFVVFVFLLWLFFHLRFRQVAARMQSRLEERLAERERIARDLHDTLLQGVASAYMQLDVANDRLPPDSTAKPLVQHVLDLMKQVSEEGRNAIRSLRGASFETDSLEQVLSRVSAEFPAQEPVDFQVIVEGKERLLNLLVRDEVCRIGREAILNAFRHAQATKIEVDVEYAFRSLDITVRDNGIGMDSKIVQAGREGHFGLFNMRERAEKINATLNVLSRPGAGTEVQLSVPAKIAFEVTTPGGLFPWWRKWVSGRAVNEIRTSTNEEEQ